MLTQLQATSVVKTPSCSDSEAMTAGLTKFSRPTRHILFQEAHDSDLFVAQLLPLSGKRLTSNLEMTDTSFERQGGTGPATPCSRLIFLIDNPKNNVWINKALKQLSAQGILDFQCFRGIWSATKLWNNSVVLSRKIDRIQKILFVSHTNK